MLQLAPRQPSLAVASLLLDPTPLIVPTPASTTMLQLPTLPTSRSTTTSTSKPPAATPRSLAILRAATLPAVTRVTPLTWQTSRTVASTYPVGSVSCSLMSSAAGTVTSASSPHLVTLPVPPALPRLLAL